MILVSGYGATEAGPVCHPFDGFEADPSDPNARTLEDWQWQRISPLTIPRWVPQGDGTYELQFLVRTRHSSINIGLLLTLRLDVRSSSTKRRELARCKGLCYLRSLGTSSHQKRSMENVRHLFVHTRVNVNEQ